MKEIVSNNLCTGCTACVNICPKKAIQMKENEEGFKYPYIDNNKCINCNLCKKTCPILNTDKNISINKCYAGYSKDYKGLMSKASSGNIFEILAKSILNEKGLVIGAAFDKKLKLKHTIIDNINDLYKLKGSKYLQSNLNDIFTVIKNNLKDKKVLFVGTPCQVAGLQSFIKQDKQNLYCIDIICHGVPSPKIFEKYVQDLEYKHNSKIIEYDFRDKKTGWDSYSNTIKFEHAHITEKYKNNIYMKIFLSDIALRKSCYNCKFKLGNKYADITLGDFWGIKECMPEMYNNNGVSAIIINTTKGLKMFDKIKKNIVYKECDITDIVDGNPSLKQSSSTNKKRDIFFKNIDKFGTLKLYNKYVKEAKLKIIIRKIYNKIIKK